MSIKNKNQSTRHYSEKQKITVKSALMNVIGGGMHNPKNIVSVTKVSLQTRIVKKSDVTTDREYFNQRTSICITTCNISFASTVELSDNLRMKQQLRQKYRPTLCTLVPAT